MKVLFLGSDVFAKGGIPRYSIYQIKALKEILGSQNIFVFSLAGYNSSNAFEDRINADYVEGGITFLNKVRFTIKALKFIKQKKVELVIANHIQLSFISFLAKKFYDVKTITNVYGIEVWTNLKKRDVMGLKNSDLIIGDCNFVLTYIKNHFGIDELRLKLLHDPVDTERFKPTAKNEKLFEKYSIPNDKFIVMTVGRLERNKGFELIIKTLPNLPNNIIYVIVGDGTQRDYLKNLVKNFKLEGRVFFTLRVPEEDLVPLYNLCDVFVLVSTFGPGEGEGLPLGLIEASACGKPVIGGNQDGSVDAINEGINGYLISPDDSEAAQQRVIKLFTDENLRIKMGEAGRNKALHEFEFGHFTLTLSKIITKP